MTLTQHSILIAAPPFVLQMYSKEARRSTTFIKLYKVSSKAFFKADGI